MAGLAKPSNNMVESKSRITGSNFRAENRGGVGLFDGVQVNQWNTQYVAYWETAAHFLEIFLESKSNLWRSGTSNLTWIRYTGNFKILYKVNQSDAYVDVTSKYTQTNTPINETQWEMSIAGLEPGYYKFNLLNNVKRLDSEWFFERENVHYNFLKNISTNKIYTIDNNVLVEVNDFGLDNIKDIGILSNSVVEVNDILDFETIIGTPFEIVSYDEYGTYPSIFIETIHETKKIISSKEIAIIGVDSINNILITSSGTPLHSISFDGGASWMKYDVDRWVNIDDIYDGMTTEELNLLTNNEFEMLRGESNYIQIQHILDIGDEISSVKIICNMSGLEKVAKSASYDSEYDYNTRVITYTINKLGTYTINYLDV